MCPLSGTRRLNLGLGCVPSIFTRSLRSSFLLKAKDFDIMEGRRKMPDLDTAFTSLVTVTLDHNCQTAHMHAPTPTIHVNTEQCKKEEVYIKQTEE